MYGKTIAYALFVQRKPKLTNNFGFWRISTSITDKKDYQSEKNTRQCLSKYPSLSMFNGRTLIGTFASSWVWIYPKTCTSNNTFRKTMEAIFCVKIIFQWSIWFKRSSRQHNLKTFKPIQIHSIRVHRFIANRKTNWIDPTLNALSSWHWMKSNLDWYLQK